MPKSIIKKLIKWGKRRKTSKEKDKEFNLETKVETALYLNVKAVLPGIDMQFNQHNKCETKSLQHEDN